MKHFDVPGRETVDGSRRCIVCRATDLRCTCNNDYHAAEARRILGKRVPQENTDE